MGGLRCTHPYRFRYQKLQEPRSWAIFYEGSHIGDVQERRNRGRWEWFYRKPGCATWTCKARGGYPGHRYGCSTTLFLMGRSQFLMVPTP